MSRSVQRIDVLKRLGPPIEFSPDDRARIEAAYGHKLTSAQWVQVTGATSLLTAIVGGIGNAAPVRVVLKKLQKLTDAAKSLRQEFTEDELPDYRKLTLEAIHAKFFKHPMPTPLAHELSYFLLRVLEATIATSEFVAEEFNKEPMGLAPGEIWDIWIVMLTNIMKANNLPYKVRKDTDKRKPGSPPSPFVMLIWELQESPPEEFRKFTQDPDSLAQGIYRGRHGAE